MAYTAFEMQKFIGADGVPCIRSPFADVSRSDLSLVPHDSPCPALASLSFRGASCDIRKPHGSPFPFDTHRALARAVEERKQAGFRARIGPKASSAFCRFAEGILKTYEG